MSALSDVVCPACRAALHVSAEVTVCGACGKAYPRVGGLLVLLPEAEAHVQLWRGQLGLLLERGQKTFDGLRDAAAAPDLLDSTRTRLLALGQAVRQQVTDVQAVLEPALGGAAAPGQGLPRGVVEYVGYLYRDWGWPSVGYDENAAALTSLAELLGERALGRVLVLGAGAGGLAYELHRRHGATQTIAVDVDPFLLVMAEQLVRGKTIPLTEASLKVLETSDVSRTWQLMASGGALGAEAFQCVFADGTSPPFAPGSFDSVVTPWFVDQVPRDLPAFAATVRRLLRTGGLWLNQGPLIYPEQVPFERRYSQDELFELAAAAGFERLSASRRSLRYLVSPLSGHGKIETVLSCLWRRGAAEKG